MTCNEPLMIVKITISMLKSHGIVEEVVYYNYKIPMRVVLRYEWYFDYLQALIKTHNPHRKVELSILRQESPCGQDYADSKRDTLIQGKKSHITRLRSRKIVDDIFGFARAEQEEKIAKVQSEIESLERGEFNYYIPPTYINRVKKWIK